MKRKGRATRTIAALALSTAVPPGVAQGQEPAAQGALAEMLYRQGRALIAEGKATEACPKFAESYRLDAATGTLLNLASCHETEGKLATAWLEFSRAVALARRDRRYDRVRFAQERLAVIEPKLSYLTVMVPSGSDALGLELRVDGVSVRGEARGVSTPIDPGHHTIEATAPKRKPWSHDVSIGEGATNLAVSIPTLEPATPDAPPASDLPAAPSSPARPVPTSVYVVGGVTLALAVAAGTTAFIYMDHRARDGVEQREPELGQNRRLGAINVALDFGALLGAGATVYLYVTRPADVSPAFTVTGANEVQMHERRMSLVPWVRPGAAGLGVEGAF